MIELVILIVAGAFASGYISRGLVDRAGTLPPATRRAIRRDREQRIADISRARSQASPAPADPLDERLTSAIAKLGDRYEPPAGWQDRAISEARQRPCAACGATGGKEQPRG